jgi:hypothetical protein
MRKSHHAGCGGQQSRSRRALPAMAIAVALCLGATGCNSDDGGPDTDGSTTNLGQRARPTEKSVRAFYARASKAYRTGDAKQLCSMMQPGYAAAMVKRAAASGVDVSTCPEMWRLVFNADPEGYKGQDQQGCREGQDRDVPLWRRPVAPSVRPR